MILIRLLLLPFRLLLTLLRGIIRHPRLIVVLILIIMVAVGFTTCGKSFDGLFGKKGAATSDIPEMTQHYNQIAPSVSQANYVLQTSTRAYYVQSYTVKEHILTLNEYYNYDKNTWKKSTNLIIDLNIWGKVILYDRSSGKNLYSWPPAASVINASHSVGY